jgi:hypothetical protein
MKRGTYIVGVQLDGLLKEIENCRQKMVRLASETSVANLHVIKISVRLDSLLNKYNVLKSRDRL